MRNRHVGLDLGERRLFGAIIASTAGSASISFSPDTEPTEVLDWCRRSDPQRVAIDAPPAHSKGLARVGNRRVAEERLGIATTPPEELSRDVYLIADTRQGLAKERGKNQVVAI